MTPFNNKWPNVELLQSSSNWLKLSQMTPQEVYALEMEWYEINKSNIAIANANGAIFKEKFEALKAALTAAGLQYMERSGFKKEKPKKWFAAMESELRAQYCPTCPSMPARYGGVVTVTLGGIHTVNVRASRLQELYDELTYQINSKKKAANSHDKELVAAVQYAVANKLALSFQKPLIELSGDEIIKTANELAKAEFMKKNYPDGTTISIDDNYCECETYTFGSNRCSCGNRRISAYPEGSLATGFALEVEPY